MLNCAAAGAACGVGCFLKGKDMAGGGGGPSREAQEWARIAAQFAAVEAALRRDLGAPGTRRERSYEFGVEPEQGASLSEAVPVYGNCGGGGGGGVAWRCWVAGQRSLRAVLEASRISVGLYCE